MNSREAYVIHRAVNTDVQIVIYRYVILGIVDHEPCEGSVIVTVIF